ncbi:MAG: helix-turn-helix domain-containing protein [Legionellaceae bacterium]|nr:helix-turn-helix domain-containing protein [Legionellaceae bacterium]
MAITLTDKDYMSTIKYWQKITPLVHVPKNDTEYNKLNALLGRLLDEIEGDESHYLISLVDTIDTMIQTYDNDQHSSDIKGSAIDALEFLMEQHNLKQRDLSDIASQGVISEILNGRRDLNVKQIKKLADKFHVSPDVFID